LEISNPQYGVSFARSDAILDPLKYALSSSNGSKLIKGLVSHWFGWKLLQRPFSLKASSALPMHRRVCDIRNFVPQNCIPNFFPSFYPILPIFSGMEDPLKVFHSPPKVSPKLLLVSHKLRANLGFGASRSHMVTVLMVKNGCNRFLTQKYKIDAVCATLTLRWSMALYGL